MATEAAYTDTVWYRISKGAPQAPSGLWRSAAQATLPNALQRLADQVAADPFLFPLLQREYAGLTLIGGEVSITSINTVGPTLLVSDDARRRWRLTMTNVPFALEYVPNRTDLDNPPPIQDFYYYTVFNDLIVVRDYTGTAPVETDLQIFGNYVPEITNTVFDDGELFDNLIDIGVALTLAAGAPAAG